MNRKSERNKRRTTAIDPERVKKEHYSSENIAKRQQRTQNLAEIHKEHTRTALKLYKNKPKGLQSVHKDLQGTESKNYVTTLKNRLTPSEEHIYQFLLRRRVPFVVQMPIKNDYSFYIIDFYIPKFKLCLEIDGGYHNTPQQQWRDKQRDSWLSAKGYKIVRLENAEADTMTYDQFKHLIRL